MEATNLSGRIYCDVPRKLTEAELEVLADEWYVQIDSESHIGQGYTGDGWWYCFENERGQPHEEFLKLLQRF